VYSSLMTWAGYYRGRLATKLRRLHTTMTDPKAEEAKAVCPAVRPTGNISGRRHADGRAIPQGRPAPGQRRALVWAGGSASLSIELAVGPRKAQPRSPAWLQADWIQTGHRCLANPLSV
jgi:hypothetical protein